MELSQIVRLIKERRVYALFFIRFAKPTAKVAPISPNDSPRGLPVLQ